MPDKQNKAISKKEEINQHPDPKITEDFQGYPHGPASDETIKPRTKQAEKTAGTDEKDGEKIIIRPEDRKSLDEQDADGSANAFDDK